MKKKYRDKKPSEPFKIKIYIVSCVKGKKAKKAEYYKTKLEKTFSADPHLIINAETLIEPDIKKIIQKVLKEDNELKNCCRILLGCSSAGAMVARLASTTNSNNDSKSTTFNDVWIIDPLDEDSNHVLDKHVASIKRDIVAFNDINSQENGGDFKMKSINSKDLKSPDRVAYVGDWLPKANKEISELRQPKNDKGSNTFAGFKHRKTAFEGGKTASEHRKTDANLMADDDYHNAVRGALNSYGFADNTSRLAAFDSEALMKGQMLKRSALSTPDPAALRRTETPPRSLPPIKPPPATVPSDDEKIDIRIYSVGGAADDSDEHDSEIGNAEHYKNAIREILDKKNYIKSEYATVNILIYKWHEKDKVIKDIEQSSKLKNCYRLLIGHSYGGSVSLSIAYSIRKDIKGNIPISSLLNDLLLVDPVGGGGYHVFDQNIESIHQNVDIFENTFYWLGGKEHFKIKFVRPEKHTISDVIASIGGWWSYSKAIIERLVHLGYKNSEDDLTTASTYHHGDFKSIVEDYKFIDHAIKQCYAHYKKYSKDPDRHYFAE